LNQDGTCTFNGSFHDSGFVPYGVAFALVVNTSTGKAFSFTKSGRVSGTIDILADPTKSRDFSWSDNVQNPAVTAAWDDLVAKSDFHWKADVNGDVVHILKDVVNIVKQAVPIVQTVAVVGAAL
jgi:O-succinylbenzoate synthase